MDNDRLEENLISALAGSCNCATTSPDMRYHADRCRAKRLSIVKEEAESLRQRLNEMEQRAERAEQALRNLLKAYERTFDWNADLPPETIKAEADANAVLAAIEEQKG